MNRLPLEGRLADVWLELYDAQKAAEAAGNTALADAYQRAHLRVNEASCVLIDARSAAQGEGA